MKIYSYVERKKSTDVLWDGRVVASFNTKEEARAFIRGANFQKSLTAVILKGLS